ncbi:hypothetical protein CN884_20875 [Ochrobactrum sp. 30A/1000/2015]|nr:hypothetical protein CN884_20875 [Ochrobactrum sp. 30A/1000/2015]PJT39542.1 hypothetical protein CN883_06800 [Ochrobactrum sp. 27A/999/2015]PJT43836.1 hypothetical protein CN882_07975 [Ochrobactrum sp. 23A/997/2015]
MGVCIHIVNTNSDGKGLDVALRAGLSAAPEPRLWRVSAIRLQSHNAWLSLIRNAVPTLKRRGIITGGPPALYSAMWKRVRPRAGAAAAASHLRKKVAKGVALARRKKTLRPFAA